MTTARPPHPLPSPARREGRKIAERAALKERSGDESEGAHRVIRRDVGALVAASALGCWFLCVPLPIADIRHAAFLHEVGSLVSEPLNFEKAEKLTALAQSAASELRSDHKGSATSNCRHSLPSLPSDY